MKTEISLSDYLLTRSQIMILNPDIITEIYQGYDNMKEYLETLKITLIIDDFLLLNEEYIDTVLITVNNFRRESQKQEIKELCNAIILQMNSHLLKFSPEQRLNMQRKYLEIQRNAHHIDKYEEQLDRNFIIELLKNEYLYITSIYECIENGAKIYDDNNNVIKEVDIIKEKDNIDFSHLGLGNYNKNDIYDYLSNYNFTFSMYSLLDELKKRPYEPIDMKKLELMSALLSIAERDKKINKENYKNKQVVTTDTKIGRIKIVTDIDFLKPVINKTNNFIQILENTEQRIIDHEVNRYCSRKTKELIKTIDNEIKKQAK